MFNSKVIKDFIEKRKIIHQQIEKILNDKQLIAKGYYFSDFDVDLKYPEKGIRCEINEGLFAEDSYVEYIPWEELDQWIERKEMLKSL